MREVRTRGRGVVRVYGGAAEVARAAAERFAERAREAVAERGAFRVALSGGSTPRAAYAALAEEPFLSSVPWDRVHLYWGDERCVPPGHPRSNFHMAHGALISRVPLPPGNVHRMRGELPPERGAAEYERVLAETWGEGVPRFDLVHLGLGDDAHTASLFPFAAALQERRRRVARALHLPDGEPRVTLTVLVLRAAAQVDFLVVGAAKRAVARRVICGALDPFRLPAQLVRPVRGDLTWLLDEAAAAELQGTAYRRQGTAGDDNDR